MKYLLLLLLASTTRAAPLVQPQDLAPCVGNAAEGSYCINMKSVDGVAQSSGCVVQIGVSANTGATTDVYTFTSTTTQNNGVFGVLMDNNCKPGDTCRVGVLGKFRVITDGCSNDNGLGTATTRCAAHDAGAITFANSYAFCLPANGSYSGASVPGWIQIQ